MSPRKFASVWDAIEDTQSQAASMKAKAELLIALQQSITASGLTQTAAAKQLGVTQPRISDLMRGRIDLFSLETLIDLLGRSGLKVKFRLTKAA
jgi:predicted XRE-type DNA-binding protein